MNGNYRRQNISCDRSSGCLSSITAGNVCNRNLAYGSSVDLYNRNLASGNLHAGKVGVSVRNSVSVSECLNNSGMQKKDLAIDSVTSGDVYNRKSASNMEVCKSRNFAKSSDIGVCNRSSATHVNGSVSGYQPSYTSQSDRNTLPEWITSPTNNHPSSVGELHSKPRTITNGCVPRKGFGGVENRKHYGIADSVDVLDLVQGTDRGDLNEEGM